MEFFSKQKPSVRAVQQHINYLTAHLQHEHVIALLNAAIIQGQAQPWMYEILAVTMEAAGRPQEEVDRVILSVADFGNASYQTMMYSASYLNEFGRTNAALRMYREASRLQPERPEPYALGLKLASRSSDPQDAVWAACGTLQNVWSIDAEQLHKQAEDLLTAAADKLRKSGQTELQADLKRREEFARHRDLRIRLDWSGTADLDLSVEDPAGSTASFEWRESPGGGYLRNDGYGPDPTNCHEEYVCPLGFSGEYVIRVHKASGKVVGNRARLTITTHQGTPAEKSVSKSMLFDQSPDQLLRITLEDGRREQKRTTFQVSPQQSLRQWEISSAISRRPLRRQADPGVRQAVAEFQASRQGRLPSRAQPISNTGGVGFAPIVRWIPEGTQMAAQAVVSPDRRYVRLSLSPVFSQIVDVAVFTFQGGNGR